LGQNWRGAKHQRCPLAVYPGRRQGGFGEWKKKEKGGTRGGEEGEGASRREVKGEGGKDLRPKKA